MFFFFNDTATTEIYTLSLHDALPIWTPFCEAFRGPRAGSMEKADARRSASRSKWAGVCANDCRGSEDRKSTRLNSSHANISYAVFCLKKKNNSILLLSRPDVDAAQID